MSRPQYEHYQAPQQRTQVVNGGLIDFQDNSLQRGATDYITPNQFMAAAQNGQMVQANGYAQNGQMVQANGYAQNGQMVQANGYTQNGQMVQANGQMVQAFQPVQTVQAASPYTGGGQQQPMVNQGVQAYISGPPTFLHMNGVTYKPVDEHSVTPAPDARVGAGPKSNEPAAVDAPVPPGVKTLSEEEFHQAISDHVQKKVDSYMSKQLRKHDHGRSDQQGKAARQAVKARAGIDEEQAAVRVQAVNASMRGRPSPASSWQASVNNW